MAFEMVEGFFAIEAAVDGFAGSRTELADQFGVIRIAPRALDRFLLKHF